MKACTVRLLSACLALSLLAGLTPAALAREPEDPPALTGITLSGPRTVEVDQTASLTVRLEPEGAEGELEWTSSSDAVATVRDGVVTGRSPGQAEITARCGEVRSNPLTLTVTGPEPVPVTGVRLDRNELTLRPGESATLSASVEPGDAADQTVRWSSDDEQVAWVRDGRVTALRPGIAVITAATRDGNHTDRCRVTVEEAAQPGVTVTPSRHTLAPGQSITLSAATVPQGQSVLWSSSDPEAASVDSRTGRVTAHAPARQTTVVITASFNYEGRNYSGACTLTVTPAAAPTLPQTASVRVGQSVTLSVSNLPAGARVAWSGGNAALRLSASTGASVTASGGQLSGSAATVPVTADVSWDGQSARLTCRVTVSPGAVQDITYKGVKAGQEQAFAQKDFQAVCRAVYGYELKSVSFRKVTGGELTFNGREISLSRSTFSPSDLGQVAFLAGTGSAGSVSYDAVDAGGNRYSGAVKLTLAAGGGDVRYASPAGGAVLFDRADFQAVCKSAVGGTLDYVTFTLPAASKGTLYHDYDSRAGKGESLRAKDPCCYSPGRREIGLDTVAFLPAKDFEGAVSIPFSGRSTAGKSFSGTVSVAVGAEKGDISCKAAVNGAAELDARDFYDLCRSAVGGTLDYVTFTLPAASKGTLYYDYDSRAGKGEALRAKDPCCYKPGRREIGLDTVAFVPAKDFEGTVSIPFSGRNTAGKSFSGTLVVKVGSGVSASLTLEGTAGQPVKLDAEGLNRFCREETGRALDYVAFDWASGRRAGTLYHRYGQAGEKEAGSARYYRTGSPALSELTFVPGSDTGETVRIPFTGRSEGGKSFSGALAIRFTARRNPDPVRYTSGGTAVTLRAADLSAAWTARGGRALQSVRFTLPDSRTGRLYYDYAGPARYRGTVTADVDYTVGGLYQLDKVAFQPRAEYSGTVVIPYTGTDAAGAVCQGTVEISVTPPASSPRFSDMGGYGWAAPGVEFLAACGITTGTGTGATFSPAGPMTRCDYVLMLVRAFGFTGGGGEGFADVPAGSYYASALSTARALGIIQAGPGNTFRPTDPVTRQDAMVFLFRAMEKAGRPLPYAQDSWLARFPDGGGVEAAARPALAAMVQAGVILGDQAGRLNPQGTLTRAEMAVILHRGLTF